MRQTEGLVFGDVRLDRSCLFAQRDGKEIRFTRSERSLLLALSRNPHRLMRRSQLLDVVASADSDTSDRPACRRRHSWRLMPWPFSSRLSAGGH